MAAIPFYAVLGNHDVQGNAEAQIQYSQEQAGSGRWQMPAHFYRSDFGTDDGHPLLRIVFIDTNQLTPESLDRQARFIEQAFAPSGGRPTWRVVVAHHPIRNFGKHGETPQLVSALLPVLQKAHVDLYLTGHDHDQQLIARDGEPYYVISGGGGQGLYRVARDHEGLVFGESQHGFAKIVVDPERMAISFYAEGAELAGQYAVNRICAGLAVGCLQQTSEPGNAKK
ncbi:MAG TPA: metallophosphoesterase [Accumulibacter sp.]|uniref:metallophosphoesterase n=1 Tax=Accumulibacter sp. TaxID=2053492 RepID=UPI002C37062E|nr:metallophosphoesterase [Accumulibacter sp.]HRF73647.1 metallophosphoesterase [Accumulibacter sp.]